MEPKMVEIDALPALAKDILSRLPQEGTKAALIALQGELGAGKTTFMQAFARELGIEEAVQSPTYVLMKSYKIAHGRFTKLVHIDAYRLEKPEEFNALEPATFLDDPHALVCIEWPERIEGVVPQPDLTIHLSSEGVGEKERRVRVV